MQNIGIIVEKIKLVCNIFRFTPIKGIIVLNYELVYI